MNQSIVKPTGTRPLKKDRTYESWIADDVIKKAWQVYTLSGENYIKIDLSGNFMHQGSMKVLSINKIFHLIRNCSDVKGHKIATRKRINAPLYPENNNNKKLPIK